MLPRIVKHRDDDTKPLFQFPVLSSYSDCPDRIVCLSERDFNIILNALYPVEKMHTRVYSAYLGNSSYQMVTEEEFEQFQEYISDIRTNLGGYMACNEYLERIALALEAQLANEDSRYVNLADVLEVLELEPSEEVADWLEVVQYLIGLFPGLNLSIPIPDLLGFDLGQMRYRSAHLQLLRDIAISQRGQAVAQGGVDFAALYDTMGETVENMIKPAGFAGVAYSFWRWLSNDQIPGWSGWVTIISGLILGSIRNATYDVAAAIEGLTELGSSEHPINIIQECCDPIGVNPNGGTGGTGIIPADPNPFTPTDQNSFPTGFINVDAYRTHKCKAGGQVISGLIFDLNKIAVMTYSGTSILEIVGILVTFIRSATPYDNLVNIASALLFTPEVQDDCADLAFFLESDGFTANCVFYSAPNAEQARSNFIQYLHDYIDSTGMTAVEKAALKGIATYLVSYDLVNRLFGNNPQFEDDGWFCDDCEDVLPFEWEWPASDKQGWLNRVLAGGATVTFPTTTGTTAIRLVNDGSAIQKIGEWYLDFAEGDRPLIPANTICRIHARSTGTQCANGIAWGVVYEDDTLDYGNISPYTYTHPTVFQNEDHVLTGGRIKTIFWQYSQAPGCTNAGNYELRVNRIGIYYT